MKTTKQKRSNKKAGKAQLDENVAEIRKLQKEATEGKRAKKKTEVLAPLEPVVIPESTRPIQDILRDRVTMLPGNVGLKLADNTPIEENLAILDWTTQLSAHAGFMIGDVLVAGENSYGEANYNQALNQTGIARTTLKHYKWEAKNIPPSKRFAHLTFTHHEEALRVVDPHAAVKLLKDFTDESEHNGSVIKRSDLRARVNVLKPRKLKKVTIGKGKKRKAKPEPLPYQPTPDEQSKMDMAEDALKEVNAAIKDGKVEELILKCDNGEKRRWTKTLLLPVFELYKTVERYTGY